MWLQVSSLEVLGVETVIMSVDRQNANLVHEISSKEAAAFLDSTHTVNSFAFHFNG